MCQRLFAKKISTKKCLRKCLLFSQVKLSIKFNLSPYWSVPFFFIYLYIFVLKTHLNHGLCAFKKNGKDIGKIEVCCSYASGPSDVQALTIKLGDFLFLLSDDHRQRQKIFLASEHDSRFFERHSCQRALRTYYD